MNISENDNSLSFDLAVEVAEEFRLKKDEVKKINDDITNKVSTWKTIAGKYDIPKSRTVKDGKSISKIIRLVRCVIGLAHIFNIKQYKLMFDINFVKSKLTSII